MTGWRKRQIVNLQDNQWMLWGSLKFYFHKEQKHMSIEAMKQALEHGSFPQGSGVIHALRQAIAEAEKGPVKVTLEDFLKAVEGREKIQGRPVYWAEWPVRESDSSSQRQWVGLTDKEQRDIEDACETVVSKHVFNVIEAKLRSKNT